MLHALVLGSYDVIHLHHAEAAFVLPLLRLRYRIVGTSHGNAYWRAKWGPVAKCLLKMMDAPFARLPHVVTSVSRLGAEELQARSGRHVVFIPNGIGPEVQPDLGAARGVLQEHGLSAEAYLLFVAGRIEPTKGAHLAIQAVNGLDKEFPLLIVGDMSQVPAYARSLRSMAGPTVHFQDLIRKPGALYGLMAGTTCLLFPSTVEAMSMVLLEAASLGVPILASDIEENRQVLGEQAQYFRCGDSQSLAQKLKELLRNPEPARERAATLAERVRRDFSWDSIARQYAQLYHEVCSNDA
jgi:glycosyltransferase involved in cell wall biosynthesis